ncbi:Gfo/Idh/MocA family oxidoreductase [Rhodovarius crocodyli]|uniref:Gfo/Idh/MocA family oxidoreductase n=1 Tax=Rhodovarius crocodyli TaxID=1979269 RepID=A0A437MCE0_9PROT|nr:Gfo/Idh/MocA family oxidoreductase [Rhodovarius crocodyli]
MQDGIHVLKIGVIGAGHFGRFHALKLAKAGVLSGIADASAERAGQIAAETGAPALDVAGLLAASDAVVVAAPTAFHFDLGMQVLAAGRHLFMEKPIAATLEQADALIEAAAARNLTLQVGHIERYSAAIMTLRRELAGFSARSLTATRVAPFRPRSLDVSVVLDLMIHDLDLVLSLVPSPLAEVRAVGRPVMSQLPDYSVAQLLFADGTQAQITASRVAVAMERRLTLLGDAGEVRVDFLARELRALRPGGAEAAENMPRWGRDAATWTEHDSLEAEQNAFMAAIIKAQTPEANGAIARAALSAALQVEAAMRGA